MDFFRNVELSVAKKVEDLFENPPDGPTTNYNVYCEDNFMSTTFVPTEPFIFLLDYRVRPKASRLPMVIIERAAAPHSLFEIGNRAGHLFTFNINIFGRNRGERSDLAAFLERNLEYLDIYNFTPTTPSLLEEVPVISRAAVQPTETPEVGIEGALNNPESVIFSFQTKE